MKAIIVALEDEFPIELMEELENKDDFNVFYTGVGKVNATILSMLAVANPETEVIINFGTAGCLDKSMEGKLHRVGVVRQRDMDARPQAELGVTPFEETQFKGDIKVNDSKVVLSTGDNFVMEKPELDSHLVDMEGYAIAKVAGAFQKTSYYHEVCLIWQTKMRQLIGKQIVLKARNYSRVSKRKSWIVLIFME